MDVHLTEICSAIWLSTRTGSDNVNLWTRTSEVSRNMKGPNISAAGSVQLDGKILFWFISVNMMIFNLILLLVRIYTVFSF
jgi:hypothetical protein